MPQNESSTMDNRDEILTDITDQTLADDGPSDIPSALPDPAFEAGVEDVASLRAQLEQANQRADAEHEAFLRALADFANYKRRTQEETARQREYVNESLLGRLLPIVDNFERALQSAQATQDYDKLVGGVHAILRQLQEFLTKEGLQAIKADQGDPFDPNYHNAVMRHETTEYAENTIVEELQKGYTLGERVLRPSMVKVATGTE